MEFVLILLVVFLISVFFCIFKLTTLTLSPCRAPPVVASDENKKASTVVNKNESVQTAVRQRAPRAN